MWDCNEMMEETSLMATEMMRDSPLSPGDSGYITLSPHSLNVSTPQVQNCRRLASSYVTTSKRLRTRLDPWHSSSVTRHRVRLNSQGSSDEKDVSEANSYHGVFSMRLRSRQLLDSRESSAFGILASPPSPAVADLVEQSMEEDVDMKKLVMVSQSTPHTSPSTSHSHSHIASPKLTSLENRKLGRLRISERIKPKALDFGDGPFGPSRSIPDYTGRDTLDVLTMLGEKSNHWKIVSKILSYLSPQDLCAVSMVSKSWQRICVNDNRANVRRLTHVVLRQNFKENMAKIKKSKQDTPTSPRNRYARKGMLLQVQNLLMGPQKLPPNSPPVSPSKVKFHSYVKASRTLAPWEHLLPCPKCSFASHVNNEKNLAVCSRQNCSMEFCTTCLSKTHSGPCKTPLLATPTKRRKQLVIGSRQSKRNLRRL